MKDAYLSIRRLLEAESLLLKIKSINKRQGTLPRRRERRTLPIHTLSRLRHYRHSSGRWNPGDYRYRVDDFIKQSFISSFCDIMPVLRKQNEKSTAAWIPAFAGMRSCG